MSLSDRMVVYVQVYLHYNDSGSDGNPRNADGEGQFVNSAKVHLRHNDILYGSKCISVQNCLAPKGPYYAHPSRFMQILIIPQ